MTKVSSNLLVVLPVVSRPTADLLVASLQREDNACEIDADDFLVIDNTREGWADKYGYRTYRDPDGHNLGVARSWNVGAREVLDRGLDYLVIMSTSMLFGPILQTTLWRQMNTFWGANVIESEGHSWHLIAIHRHAFEAIGLFDENFYPAYWEADDFSFRLRQVGMEGGWPKVWVNAMSQGHALNITGPDAIDCPAEPLLAYKREKWGGDKHAETFSLPFGDQPLDYWPKRSIPELAHRYGLKNWW